MNIDADVAPPLESKSSRSLRTLLVDAAETSARILLSYAGLMAWFGVAVLTLRSAAPASPQTAWLASLVVAAAGGTILWLTKRHVLDLVNDVLNLLSRIPERRWLAGCLMFGLALRIIWAISFPGEPNSDGKTYLVLANRLLSGEPYQNGYLRAFWPPGYPFFLLPWLSVFGGERLAILVSNLFLFVVGTLGVRSLASHATSARGSRLAVLIFSIWPNLVFQAGMPEKEQVLVALLPWVLAFSYGSATQCQTPLRQLLAGVLLGMATLVQPALQLLPAALACYWFIASRKLGKVLFLTALTVVGMALVIAPWTIRNYQVFNSFVLVSTNGGYGLYGVNNPRASGGYYQHWDEEKATMLPELDADRVLKQAAFRWIGDNPGKFLALAFEKNIRYMGDDAVGAYQSLKRGEGSTSPLIYAVAKGVSNAFWLTTWALILGGLFASWSLGTRLAAVDLLIPFAFLYGYLLHSIVESAGKYHVLMTGLLCVLIPLLVETSSRQAQNATYPNPTGRPRA